MITPPTGHEFDPTVQKIIGFDRELERPDLRVFSHYAGAGEVIDREVTMPGSFQELDLATAASGDDLPDIARGYTVAARLTRFDTVTSGKPADFVAEYFVHAAVSQAERFAPAVLARSLRRMARSAEERRPGVRIAIVGEAALADTDMGDLEPYIMTETDEPFRRLWTRDLGEQVDPSDRRFERVATWRQTLGAIAMPTDETIRYLHDEAHRLDPRPR